jgi:hypothetical protein
VGDGSVAIHYVHEYLESLSQHRPPDIRFGRPPPDALRRDWSVDAVDNPLLSTAFLNSTRAVTEPPQRQGPRVHQIQRFGVVNRYEDVGVAGSADRSPPAARRRRRHKQAALDDSPERPWKMRGRPTIPMCGAQSGFRFEVDAGLPLAWVTVSPLTLSSSTSR